MKMMKVTGFPSVLKILPLLVFLLASNVLVSAQDEGQELADLQSEPVDDISAGSLTDDYVICPPDELPEPIPQEPHDPKSKDIRTKFEDNVHPIVNDDDHRIRPIGMRPGPRVPFDELKMIKDQEDVDLLDLAESLPVSDLQRVYANSADINEASGDDEDLQEEPSQSEPENASEELKIVQVGPENSNAPLFDRGDSSLESADGERGPLKHLKAETLYNLAEGETNAQGVKKFLEQHPEEVVLTSPNYPNPYPSVIDDMRNFSVEGGRGVQITIHDLDLNPTTDFLYIRAGNIEDVDEKGPVLTGTYREPQRFLIPQTTFFTIHFVAQQDPEGDQKHLGFQLSYAPFGEVNSPTTPTTTEVIVPQEEFQWTTKEIVVTPELQELQSTWDEIKVALSNASNQYIESHNMTYMPSRPFDVKLLVRKCPDTWRNYENCVTLKFAVPLRPIFYEPTDDDDGLDFGFGNKFLQKGFISISTTEATEPQYALDVTLLDEMWDEYGQMALQRAGYDLYIMPENGRILMTWIGISLAIVFTFLFVLYMIWKIDIFKDYRRISRTSHGAPVDDDKNELKKKEFDISMFPSPHQVVPTFFPTGDPYNGAEADEQYAYDNATMSQWPEDFNEPRYPETSFTGGHQPHGDQRTGPVRPYEPVSPMDLSSPPVDFNGSPRSGRPSAGGRNNPYLSPRGKPRTSKGNAPPPPPPPPGMR